MSEQQQPLTAEIVKALIESNTNFVIELRKLNTTQNELLVVNKRIDSKLDSINGQFKNGFKSDIVNNIFDELKPIRKTITALWVSIIGGITIIGSLIGIILILLNKGSA